MLFCFSTGNETTCWCLPGYRLCQKLSAVTVATRCSCTYLQYRHGFAWTISERLWRVIPQWTFRPDITFTESTKELIQSIHLRFRNPQKFCSPPPPKKGDDQSEVCVKYTLAAREGKRSEHSLLKRHDLGPRKQGAICHAS